jgi:acetyl esterase/lipase
VHRHGLSVACLVMVIGGMLSAAGGEHRTIADIPYRAVRGGNTAASDRCRLDLHHPTDVPGFATVVWFHGGGLTKGRREIPLALREQGFAVVGAGYRLSPTVKAATCIEDAAAAVAWVFHSIEKYGGSRSHIIISGHSAGGYLATLVGLDKRLLAAHGIDANDLAGIVPYSGQSITHFTIRAERGIPDHQPLIDEYAPLFHVRSDAPPLLLITGDREQELLGRYEETAYLWRMMKVAGHRDTRLEELPNTDHSSMVTPAHDHLIRLITETSRPEVVRGANESR